MEEVIFENIEANQDCGRVDGPCNLPAELDWPCDAELDPMFHLLTLPLGWLVSDVLNVGAARWVSVFVTFDSANHLHYSKMSSDELNHNDAKVLLHDQSGIAQSMHPSQAPVSKKVILKATNLNNENVASYVSGEPIWVQDPIKIAGYKWVLSIYGPDMDSALGDNAGIFSDGNGYLFLKESFNPNKFCEIGKFFLQLG